MFRMLILALAVSGMALPVAADQSQHIKNWRELMTDHGYLRDHGRNRSGPPAIAPPVVVAPLFGESGRRRALPRDCLQSVETRHGWRRIYDQDCLADRHTYTGSLPQVCRVQLTTWGGVRRGYDAQCLSDAGYRRH
jgi:hypothetical protein